VPLIHAALRLRALGRGAARSTVRLLRRHREKHA
jgi:hypothetical protein